MQISLKFGWQATGEPPGVARSLLWRCGVPRQPQRHCDNHQRRDRYASGFVASTLDIADGDFLRGNLAFAGQGSSASVINAGAIGAGDNAFVALLGGAVSNSGTITVPLGKVDLGSGERITLDLDVLP